jgi:hypothetical protein
MTDTQLQDCLNRVWQGIPGVERTTGGRLFLSWFTGGPKEPAPENTVLLCHSAIRNPGSRFFIRRLASGNLLLVNHFGYAETGQPFTGRSHLTAQLSTDDGHTWNDGLLLDERDGVSYPDGVQDKDGLIWITYDRDRGGAGEILLARFQEQDVLAGRNVSGTVVLKQVVNQLKDAQ